MRNSGGGKRAGRPKKYFNRSNRPRRKRQRKEGRMRHRRQVKRATKENKELLENYWMDPTGLDVSTLDSFVKETCSHFSYQPLGGFPDMYAEPDTSPDADPLKVNLRRNLDIDTELNRSQSRLFSRMSNSRMNLPIYPLRDQIIDAVQRNPVIMICGQSGCGKTTQVPQFILESEIALGNGSVTRIIVTQPDRLSAMTASKRVASERGDSHVGQSVGFQTRLYRHFPSQIPGSIMFCTSDVVIRWLQTDPGLLKVSHIIIDDADERPWECDLLLTVLKHWLPNRSDLRVVVMSSVYHAAGSLSAYFTPCPILRIPNYLFPVRPFFLEEILHMTNFQLNKVEARALSVYQQRLFKRRLRAGEGKHKRIAHVSVKAPNSELESWLSTLPNLSPMASTILTSLNEEAYPNMDLVACLIDYLVYNTNSGAIVAFVPHVHDIDRTINLLQQLNPTVYGKSSMYVSLQSLQTDAPLPMERRLSFPGRAIYIGTHLRDKSILDAVGHVIDAGTIESPFFDPILNEYILSPRLLSQADVLQRQELAARTEGGCCYHLFSSYVYNRVMKQFLSPEITRLPLEDILLRIKLLRFGPIVPFLLSSPDAPSLGTVRRAVEVLRQMRAFDPPPNTSTLPWHELPSESEMSVREYQQLKAHHASEMKIMRCNLTAISTETLNECIDEHDRLTALGFNLAHLPSDIRCAKLMVLGALFGCLEPSVAVAAILSCRDLFKISSNDDQHKINQSRLELSQNTMSDHWMLATVVENYRKLTNPHERRTFCNEYHLHESVLQDVLRLMDDYAQYLYALNLIGTPDFSDRDANVHKHNFNLFRGIICGAFYPHVVMSKTLNSLGHCNGLRLRRLNSAGAHGFVHTKSVNSCVSSEKLNWLAYHQMVRIDDGMRSTVTEATLISLRTLMLFGGELLTRNENGRKSIYVGDWLVLNGDQRVPMLLMELRNRMERLLEFKCNSPSIAIEWKPLCPESRTLTAIVEAITCDPFMYQNQSNLCALGESAPNRYKKEDFNEDAFSDDEDNFSVDED